MVDDEESRKGKKVLGGRGGRFKYPKNLGVIVISDFTDCSCFR